MAIHVADARPLALRELGLLLAVFGFVAIFWFATDAWDDLSSWVQMLLVGISLLDAAAGMIDDFITPPAKFDEPAEPARTAADAAAAAGGGGGGMGGADAPRVAVRISWLRLRVPLDTLFLVRRYERMVVVSVGTLVADAIRLTLNSFDSFKANGALVVCAGIPWIAFLLKVFYFDLSQYHGADAGTHAVKVSTMRAAVWSLLHLPLIGTIQWIGAAVQDLLDTTPDQRWGFFAAFGSFLLVVSAQQLLHRGIGSGSRRIGKRRRMCIRLGFVFASLLGPMCVGLALDASGPGRWMCYQWWLAPAYIGAATVLAGVEAYGRGRNPLDDTGKPWEGGASPRPEGPHVALRRPRRERLAARTPWSRNNGQE